MSLDQIITVQIDRTTTQPTAAGFGTPLIAGYFPNSIFTERVVSISGSAELTTTYGFKTTDPVYIAATDMFAQNPSPPVVKIGRRALAPQQVLHVIPPVPVEGELYTVNVQGYADSSFATRALASVEQANYTVPSAGLDAEDVVDSWVTAFTGNSQDWTATKSGTGANAVLVITVDNTTMDGLLYKVTPSAGVGVKDMTADPGIATDLAAIALYDPDWYGFCLDSNSAAEIAAAAAWAEGSKLFVAQTRDPDVANVTNASDSTSIAATLEDGSFEYTMLFYHETPEEWPAAAMLGRALPEDAGSITWAYKQLASVSAQTLNTSQTLNLEGKNVNFITTLAGVNVTRYGTSSAGEYMDIIRGTDWLAARIQERVYALLIQNDKLPFTDAGIQAVRSEILAQLQQGVGRDFIAADPEPTCTVPRASEVSAADKGSRTLNDVTFRATLAGAIHKVAIEGELNL